MSFQVQYGTSKLPDRFFTGEVDAFWRSDTSFEESRLHYLAEREKLRNAQLKSPVNHHHHLSPEKKHAKIATQAAVTTAQPIAS